MAPAISVVIPLYNKRQYLSRCLRSVLNQTFEHFEAIVIDDGSTDGGGELVSELADPRFRLIAQSNRGPSAARLAGFSASTAPLVAFLDADDVVAPGFLSAVVSLASRFPRAGLFATGFRRRMPWGVERVITLPGRERQMLVVDFFRRTQDADFITSSSTAVRRPALAELGDFSVREKIGEDSVLWARIALRHPIAFDREILAIYHSEAGDSAMQSRRDAPPPFPPVVRTLREALRNGDVPPGSRAAVAACADWRTAKHADWLIDLQNRAWLIDFLESQSFALRRYRLWKYTILTGARLLPMRVLRAARFKPQRWWRNLSRRWATRLVSVEEIARAET